jgi:hypothetical protein
LSKKKKRRKKKAPEKTLLSAEEEVRLKTLLENLQDIDPTKIEEQVRSSEVAQALLKKIPPEHPNTVPILVSIREAFDQKGVQKEIKRAVFKLERKGVQIPEADQPEKTPFLMKRTESAEPNIYVGPVDGSGGRVLFMALPRIPKGYDIGMGLVNDEEGFLEFVSGTYSKKQMKEVKALFFEQVRPLVETSLSHAATILEGIHGQEGSGRVDATNNYLQLRPLILDKTSLLERPAIYDFIPPEERPQESFTDSRIQKLLNHKLLETWVVPPEDIRPLMEEIQKTEESPIFISEAQKAERINELTEKALDELYPESKRALLKNRLEETAYVFFKLGEEEYAHLSLAAALSLDKKDSILGVNPFLKALLQRTLDLFFQSIKEMAQTKEETEEEDSPKLILP